MTKCDFCDKEMTNYGSYQCYMACDDHVAEGAAVEAKMWAAMEELELEEISLTNSTS